MRAAPIFALLTLPVIAASVLGFVVMLLLPVAIVGTALNGTACVAASNCTTTMGSATLGLPEASAVMATWRGPEQQAMTYYCARFDGWPCVPVAFVEAVMYQESGGDPLAVPTAGALGLMQLLPSDFAVGQDPFDPLTNIMVGVGYLDSLDAVFEGNLALVAAGYNAGPGAVAGWGVAFGTTDWAVLSAQPEVEAWGGGQTLNYVHYVMAYYGELARGGA